MTPEEIAAAAAQAEQDAAAAAEAERLANDPGAAAEAALLAQQAEAQRIADEENAREAWAKAKGYVPAPKETPATTTQVDPYAEAEAQVAAHLERYEFAEASKLSMRIAQERAVQQVRAELIPLVSSGVLDQTVRELCKDLPDEAIEYVKANPSIAKLNPAQLQQLKADPGFSQMVRDAAELHASKAQATKALRVENTNRAPAKGLNEVQRGVAEDLRRQYPGFTDAEIQEVIREARVG